MTAEMTVNWWGHLWVLSTFYTNNKTLFFLGLFLPFALHQLIAMRLAGALAGLFVAMLLLAISRGGLAGLGIFQFVGFDLLLLPYAIVWWRMGKREIRAQQARLASLRRSWGNWRDDLAARRALKPVASASPPPVAPAPVARAILPEVSAALAIPAPAGLPAGRMRVRVVGLPARLLLIYRVMQVSAVLSVFIFYENLFQWVLSRVGKTATPILWGLVNTK